MDSTDQFRARTSFTDPLDAIVWPEMPVRRRYPKASLGARFLAHLIDLAVGYAGDRRERVPTIARAHLTSR